MNIEREIRVRDAIKYCIENFDSKTATNRIVEFWKDELKLQEQDINYSRFCKSDSEQLVCERVNNHENNRCLKCGAKAGHPCCL